MTKTSGQKYKYLENEKSFYSSDQILKKKGGRLAGSQFLVAGKEGNDFLMVGGGGGGGLQILYKKIN